ncbi:MAG: GNAT family N-acetyltransferase [Ramlibacter sp.]
MAADSMRALEFGEAVQRHEQFGLALRPATLHPGYVAADATRDARLQPTYLAFQSQDECWMHSVHLTDVAGANVKDASSPYGYGGPLATTHDPAFVQAAWSAYCEWMREHSVVVEYLRFHPVLGNERDYGGHVVDNRQVVCVDLTVDDVTSGYAPRLRQTLKKPLRAGLVYEEVPLGAHAHEFGEFYRQAMGEIGADTFYLFGDVYFEQLARSGSAKLGICHRTAAGEWLAAALFLDGRGVREYHLAATTEEGRQLAASSFVLHEAAMSARALGMKSLYLGGGTDASADNALLFFKGAFSAQRLLYRTGWHVFDTHAYDELKERFAAEWTAHPERPIFYRKV